MSKKDLDKQETKETTTTEVNMSNKDSSKKPRLTKEEKKALRRNATEIGSRLYLADECKEEGYTYRVCNITSGNIEKYKIHGGEIVTHKLTSGDGTLSHPEVDGIPREFDVGGYASGSMKAVWMRFTNEDYQIMKELETENADSQEAMIREGRDPQTGQQLIPKENLIGKISKG